jgi:hypothetical protein
MIGKIGAVQSPHITPQIMDIAQDYARIWTANWLDKKIKAFMADFDKMSEIAKHNDNIKVDAIDALRELSARGKELRDLEARAQEAHDAAIALTRKAETEAAEVCATIIAEQVAHRDEVDDFNRSADARDRSLVKRETEATERETKLTADETALGQSSHRIAALADNAEVKLTKANKAMADMAAVLARHG